MRMILVTKFACLSLIWLEGLETNPRRGSQLPGGSNSQSGSNLTGYPSDDPDGDSDF
ncbi:hypothetical protein DPMN_066578 [Dreissena polymorpha]|uniref:Uncharacterized protein n=1 Tax=Dreissena polymorpha TaxID=45954 RepID=A0A9D3YY38_DREPO|nr:hypothetical protein DPMN_066578 [Dreissena polymorpha]